MLIEKATTKHLQLLAPLFDSYRQFYQQEADLELASNYLSERLKHQQSIIFIAQDEAGQALGFTQLYPSFCSVSASSILILYDLYVAKAGRRLGVGRALMEQARHYAQQQKASRLDLETAFDNLQAQALYAQLGYQKETHFYKYSLDLND